MLGIKIYRDRSRRLIGLSQSTYLDKILKKFKIDQSKKEFLTVVQGVKLSKDSNLDHGRRNRKDEGHPLCLGHRFYKVCHAVCLAMCLAKEVPK
jgi:hypothetical protein